MDANDHPPPPMYTARAVAHLLALSPREVARRAGAGQLPGVKIGKCWRFPAAEINRLVRGETP